MYFAQLQELTSGVRFFDLDTLMRALGPDVDRSAIVRELYRLRQAGKLIAWRRELYSIDPRYGGPVIHPLELACEIHAPSYVSLCTALTLHGALNPATLARDQVRAASSVEASASRVEVIRGLGPRKAALLIGSFDPPETFSVVGTKHSGINQTSLGEVRRHSVHSKLFWGYSEELVGGGQARVALPHKALLDLWYLSPRGWTPYVYERLQLKAELMDVTALESALTMFGTTRRIETAFRNFECYAGRAYC
ncbi:MAG: hypothetical protein EA428_10115 [Spirochaetaceae bacterium]|nr:MAG: hypothetical protein EA428_10115 [Spirochaetaceae bacterium]